MQNFRPQQIYVHSSVTELASTRRILSFFSGIPSEIIEDDAFLKTPLPMTEAKKILYIARHVGAPVKSCQGMGDYVCCNYYTISLVSNCHFECTYCILQDYLKNNPVMTIFANVDDILEGVRQHALSRPDELIRVGTGELSDSLALDEITQYSKNLVEFAAANKNVVIELKTKSDRVENLLNLNHQKRTVVSWSVNPQNFIDTEELKCASLADRLTAAKKCANASYPIAFHMDPLLNFPGWEKEYRGLVDEIATQFDSSAIAWISLGSLRFTPGLKKISQERFPKSRMMTGELFPTNDGKTRYLKDIREEMYGAVQKMVSEAFPQTPNYLCMETKDVWKKSLGFVPKNNLELEGQLSRQFNV